MKQKQHSVPCPTTFTNYYISVKSGKFKSKCPTYNRIGEENLQLTKNSFVRWYKCVGHMTLSSKFRYNSQPMIGVCGKDAEWRRFLAEKLDKFGILLFKWAKVNFVSFFFWNKASVADSVKKVTNRFMALTVAIWNSFTSLIFNLISINIKLD